MICRPYQSVLSNDVFAMTTSRRMPSTSCAYQSGNVSLSPTVTSTPYGSTGLSRSAASARVSVWRGRDAQCQFANSGTTASSNTGELKRQLSAFGIVTVSRPTLVVSEPNSDAIDSHTKSRPNAAHTPQAEKLHKKK